MWGMRAVTGDSTFSLHSEGQGASKRWKRFDFVSHKDGKDKRAAGLYATEEAYNSEQVRWPRGDPSRLRAQKAMLSLSPARSALDELKRRCRASVPALSARRLSTPSPPSPNPHPEPLIWLSPQAWVLLQRYTNAKGLLGASGVEVSQSDAKKVNVTRLCFRALPSASECF